MSPNETVATKDSAQRQPSDDIRLPIRKGEPRRVIIFLSMSPSIDPIHPKNGANFVPRKTGGGPKRNEVLLKAKFPFRDLLIPESRRKGGLLALKSKMELLMGKCQGLELYGNMIDVEFAL